MRAEPRVCGYGHAQGRLRDVNNSEVNSLFLSQSNGHVSNRCSATALYSSLLLWFSFFVCLYLYLLCGSTGHKSARRTPISNGARANQLSWTPNTHSETCHNSPNRVPNGGTVHLVESMAPPRLVHLLDTPGQDRPPCHQQCELESLLVIYDTNLLPISV